MQFVYAGDDGCPILSWFRQHLRAVKCCSDAGLPGASLLLLYSGIDTLGLLAAAPDICDATKATFIDWCDRYVVTWIKSVEGQSLTALDLYGARCGILHTSTSVSGKSRTGEAREIYYQFQGQHGVNLGANTKMEPGTLDIAHFVIAFEESGLSFIADLNRDAKRLETARKRTRRFFRWVTPCGA